LFITFLAMPRFDSGPNLLPSSRLETSIHPGILVKKLIKALNWLSSLSPSHSWYLSDGEVNSWDSTTWFRIWQFQTPALKWYLQMHLVAENFISWGWWRFFFFLSSHL
jgi:hypothetical protein